MYEDALNIYTDGSSFSGPRAGGVGIRFVTFDDSGREVIEDPHVPGFKNATNNQMELEACILALKKAANHPKLPELNRICVFTDATYVVDNIKSAIFQWPKQKWLTRDGTPVLNASLWKQLVREIKKAHRRVEFEWIEGHAKDVHNKAVDRMAKDSAKSATHDPLYVVTTRRKKTSKSVVAGSVEMKGQRLQIRIITSQYLRVQKISRYKYEVLSKGSRYYGNVDIIYSTEDMRAGHHYDVSVNRNTANPQVMNVLREIER